ncbi:MAG: PAS domain-containing protein [Verrucomicrobia bacterium]|nr:PAS domain-containing protein [Verrucomicrobiota bacterium]
MPTDDAQTVNIADMVGEAASILEALPQPAFIKDAASVYLWASKAWAGLMGLDPAQIAGKTDAELFPSEVGLAHSEPARCALRSGHSCQKVIVLEMHTRGKQHVQVTASPIPGPDGIPIGVLGTARDVTESFEPAGELPSATGYRDAMALCTRSLLMSTASGEAITRFLQHLGEISRVHAVTVFEHFTTPEGELCFRPRYNWTSRACRRTCRERAAGAYGPWLVRWHEMLSMGLPVQGTLETLPPEESAVLADEGIQSVLLLPLEVNGRACGFIRLVHCAEPYHWDDAEVQLLSIAAESLSAFLMRMESDKALRAKIEEQEALWRATPDLLHIKDKDSVYIMANRAFAEFLGTPLDEIAGKTDFDLFPCDKASKFRGEDRAVLETGVTLRNLDETLVGADHQPIRAITTKVPLRDANGAVTGVIGITRDVTERAELERQVRLAQKMESIGTLAAGVAHDFNNLLTSILGFAHLSLPRLDEADPVHRYMSHVVSAGTRAQDLVRQLLTFSRQVEAERRPILLTPILKETVKFLQSTLPANVEIVTRFPEDVPRIEADPTHMHQVLMNLCVNAAHAMPDGGTLTLQLDVDICTTAPPAGNAPAPRWVVLKVRDTGCGMDEATRTRIFEPFFTTKAPGTGTGLGLSTVYGIVEDTGGTIEVESAPGQGTTFTIRMPAAAEGARVEDKEEHTPSRGGTETVLLVEDQPDVLELGRETLEQAGYTVLTAADGAEALSIYEQRGTEIDLLVTDATMPRMTGTQLIHHVLMALRSDAKIVLCSGHIVREDDRRTIEQAGGTILHKPFIPAQLLAAARHVLDAQPAVREP